MKIVTFASDNKRYFPYLVESCKRNECPLVVLGWGVPWKGFGSKIKMMQEFLATQADEELVCFVDAYDVVILQHHDIIVSKFNHIVGQRKDLLVVSEDRSSKGNMMFSMFNNLFFIRCKGAYINSGTYMGYVGALKKVINSIMNVLKEEAEDDQRHIQAVCKTKPKMFYIDELCDVFLVSCFPGKTIPRSQEGIEVVDSVIKYKEHTYPCILHASGYTNIDDILLELGYKNVLYTFDQAESSRYTRRAVYHFSWWFIRYNIVWLTCLSLVIFIVYMIIKRSRK